MEKEENIDNRLKGKTALITGGAANIGAAISQVFAECGARVFIADIEVKKGLEMEKWLRSRGLDVFFIESDLTIIEDIHRLKESILKNSKKLEILVNNVGGSEGQTLSEIDEKNFKRDVDLNFKSAIFTTKIFLPLLKKGCDPSVIYITSINALFGGFGAPVYSAMKNALHAFIRCMVSEYSGDNLRFNAICSGSVPADSKGWKVLGDKKEKILKKLKKLYPLGRYGTPDDIAKAALFLASEDASWITGQELRIDGGFSAVANLPGGKSWWEDL